jgi:prepilin-type N-terminal cleavage/methylation domain-containing protein
MERKNLKYKFLMAKRGFTLLEVLLVAAIILILVGAGSVAYLEVERRAREHSTAQRLQELATYEKFYVREFGEYALFWQLQEQGYIDPQYVEDDVPKHNEGIPYVPEYRLEFNIPGDGTYRIDAVSVLDSTADFSPRWRLVGGIWDLRPMYIDDRGIVRWTEDNRPVYS